MLPPVTKLMPPVCLDNLVSIYIAHSPRVLPPLVEKDGLVYWLDGPSILATELVLVPAAVKRHFDEFWILRACVCVIHRPKPVAAVVTCSKRNLLLLRFRPGLGAQLPLKGCLVVSLKVFLVVMCHRDVVVEARTSQHELLLKRGGVPQESERCICQHAEHHVVEFHLSQASVAAICSILDLQLHVIL